jgi:hypothetical protein
MKLSRTITLCEGVFEAFDDIVRIGVVEITHGGYNRRRLQNRDLGESTV